MTEASMHAVFLWVRDLGGFSVAVALIYQIGRLVKQLEVVTESMTTHVNRDEERFADHAHAISSQGERISKLEGAAPR